MLPPSAMLGLAVRLTVVAVAVVVTAVKDAGAGFV
jgi:hypothetical protein